jgi:hypothetical protein
MEMEQQMEHLLPEWKAERKAGQEEIKAEM